MKSIIPDPEQLDALAANLDAGWDEEPAEVSPSQPPRSASIPPNLDALDADWEVDEPAAAASETSARNAPFRASKRERREAERRRRAHEAQQRSASKEQRKAERLAEARTAAERQRAAEQQALAARQKPSKSRKRKPAPSAKEAAPAPKRDVKRARREQATPVRAAAIAAPSTPPKSSAQPVVAERAFSKLIVPLVLATVFALSLWFALSRAH